MFHPQSPGPSQYPRPSPAFGSFIYNFYPQRAVSSPGGYLVPTGARPGLHTNNTKGLIVMHHHKETNHTKPHDRDCILDIFLNFLLIAELSVLLTDTRAYQAPAPQFPSLARPLVHRRTRNS